MTEDSEGGSKEASRRQSSHTAPRGKGQLLGSPGLILRLYGDNGKENGNYYNGLYKDYGDYIGVIWDNGKKWNQLEILCRDFRVYIGILWG